MIWQKIRTLPDINTSLINDFKSVDEIGPTNGLTERGEMGTTGRYCAVRKWPLALRSWGTGIRSCRLFVQW
jgi:hypothetical protein